MKSKDKDKGKSAKVKPYDQPANSNPSSPTVRVEPSPVQQKVPGNPNCAYIEVPKPPTILKRPKVVPTGPMPMEVDIKNLVHDKGKQREKAPEASKSKPVPSTSKNRLNPNDIKVQELVKKPVYKE